MGKDIWYVSRTFVVSSPSFDYSSPYRFHYRSLITDRRYFHRQGPRKANHNLELPTTGTRHAHEEGFNLQRPVSLYSLKNLHPRINTGLFRPHFTMAAELVGWEDAVVMLPGNSARFKSYRKYMHQVCLAVIV